MINSKAEIEDRIFRCINRFQFRAIASAIAEWELYSDHFPGTNPSADKLRHKAINLLGETFHLMEHADNSMTEQSLKEHGLVAVCYRLDNGELHFQLEFIFCAADSRNENDDDN